MRGRRWLAVVWLLLCATLAARQDSCGAIFEAFGNDHPPSATEIEQAVVDCDNATAMDAAWSKAVAMRFTALLRPMARLRPANSEWQSTLGDVYVAERRYSDAADAYSWCVEALAEPSGATVVLLQDLVSNVTRVAALLKHAGAKGCLEKAIDSSVSAGNISRALALRLALQKAAEASGGGDHGAAARAYSDLALAVGSFTQGAKAMVRAEKQAARGRAADAARRRADDREALPGSSAGNSGSLVDQRSLLMFASRAHRVVADAAALLREGDIAAGVRASFKANCNFTSWVSSGVVEGTVTRAEVIAAFSACTVRHNTTEALVKRAGPLAATETNVGGWSPLLLFVALDDVVTVRSLIASGAHAGGRTRDGLTALHICACVGCSRPLEKLLSKSVPASSVDMFNRTAGDIACQRGWGALPPRACWHSPVAYKPARETLEGTAGGAGAPMRVSADQAGVHVNVLAESDIDVQGPGLLPGDVLRTHLSVAKPGLFRDAVHGSLEWSSLCGELSTPAAFRAGGPFAQLPVMICSAFSDKSSLERCRSAIAANWTEDALSTVMRTRAFGELRVARDVLRPPPLHPPEFGISTEAPTVLLASSGAFEPYTVATNALWVVVAAGRLRWYLLPPAFALYSVWHPSAEHAAVNASLLPTAVQRHGGITRDGGLRPLMCVQRSGDVIFIPDGWSYSYVADSVTIAVRGSFVPDKLEFAP